MKTTGTSHRFPVPLTKVAGWGSVGQSNRSHRAERQLLPTN